MITIKVKITEETWERMLAGVRVKGTIGYSKWTGEKDFNAWHGKSLEPGYIPESIVLYETADGSLRQTARRNKISVSVKRSLGRKRGATEIMSQARELTDYLKNTKTIEEIMDEV